MNRIDYDTSPAGFPLEADSILGFSQQALLDAILGVAQVAYTGHCIVSGVEVSGNVAANGWVIYNGELYKFVGGTVQGTCVVVETKTQKANQDGTLVDRVISRHIAFGTGTGQFAFSSFKRINRLSAMQAGLSYIAAHGSSFGASGQWIVLAGFAPNGGGLDIGVALHDGELVFANAYTTHLPTSGSPVYLTKDGEWTTTASGLYLKFDPYTEKMQERYSRNSVHPIGSMLWFKAGTGFFSTKFSSGLGIYEWKDWAIADGTNGTIDLSSAITGLTAVQRIV